MIEYRESTYAFRKHAPAACLTPERPEASVDNPGKKGFSAIFKLARDFSAAAGILAELPGAFQLEVRLAGTAPEHQRFDELQHYLNYKTKDGTCPVMEAALYLHSDLHPDWKEIRAGFPLELLPKGKKHHEVAVHFTGVRLQIFVDGKLMDENFPFGYTHAPKGARFRIDGARIDSAEFYLEALGLSETVKVRRVNQAIQYFLPKGFNTWIGDVVTFFHAGRFHIFYLLDRRHHTSKFGQGAHVFEHLSSADLANWTEHECAVDIDEQWETCGTGTPFYLDGKYYFSYGLHTTRMIPYEQTTLPVMNDYIKSHHSTALFKLADLRGFPAGALLSESDDGIHFRKTGLLMHSAENPSVFARSGGGLLMLVEGVWATTDLKEWKCINPGFPPYGKAAKLRSTLECPCMFEWNGHYYAIAGMTGFWHSRTDSFESFTDLAARGEDIYEGLGVPMVAEFGNNRRIIAGWPIFNIEFGSCLVFRELIQYPDGKLGLKWLKEALPATGAPAPLAGLFAPAEHASGKTIPVREYGPSFLLEMQVQRGEQSGVLAIRFSGSDPKVPVCEFQIRIGESRAQWNVAPERGFADPIPPAHELLAKAGPEVDYFKSLPKREYVHVYAKNFSIDRIRGLDAEFTLRFLVTHIPKMEMTILDAEIAGQRTMLSGRKNLLVDEISFASSNPGLTISELTIAKQVASER